MADTSNFDRQLEKLIVDRATADSQPSMLSRGLWRFAGLVPDYVWLAGRPDKILATVLALTLGVTVSLAFMYGAVSWSIFRTGTLQISFGVILVGLCVAGAIYVLDRALLELVKRPFDFVESFHQLETSGPGQHGGYTNLLISTAFALVTRLGVAIVMALIVSEPLLLTFFQTDIEQVLQERREDDLAIVLSEIDEQFEPLLAVEMPRESPEVAQLRSDLAVLQQRKENIEGQIDEAETESERYRLLATCEQDGSESAECDQLRESGDVSLSGEVSCGERCQSHNRSASRAEERAATLTDDRDGLVVQITSKSEQLRIATEGQRQTLFGFTLDALDESGRKFDIESPVMAAKECRQSEVRMLYRMLSFEDPRSLALFNYCGTNVDEIKATIVPRSGLNPRQDAFSVLINCSDPLGLRRRTPDSGEPLYCSRIASGPNETTTLSPPVSATEAQEEEGSFWSQIVSPLEPIFLVPNSELGRTAARIRWMLLILDTMPIIFKLGMNFRTHRPYDALIALEQHRNLHSIQSTKLTYDRKRKEHQPIDADPSKAAHLDGRTLTKAFARWRKQTTERLRDNNDEAPERNDTPKTQSDNTALTFANVQEKRLSRFDTSSDPFHVDGKNGSDVIDLTEEIDQTADRGRDATRD